MGGYIGATPFTKATRDLTTHSPSTGQVKFVKNYTPGYLDVILNGSVLHPSEYTASDGTSFTLDTAVLSSDQLISIAWSTFEPANIDEYARVGQYAGLNIQTGTTYAPVATDKGKIITCNNASAITVTINQNIFSANDLLYLTAGDVGQVTVVAGTNVTMWKPASFNAKTMEQYAILSLMFTSSNYFIISGMMEAA